MSQEQMELLDQLKVTISKIKCLGFLLTQQRFCEADVNDKDDIELGLYTLFKEIYSELDSVKEQLSSDSE